VLWETENPIAALVSNAQKEKHSNKLETLGAFVILKATTFSSLQAVVMFDTIVGNVLESQ